MRFVKLELSGKYQEIGSQVTRLGKARQRHFRFDLFYAKIEHIIECRSIQRILVERKKSFSVPAFGGLEEIRSALQRLSEAGKDVYYYSPEYDLSDCVLSSACKHRILHPLGQVTFLGLAVQSVFFRKMLETHEIAVTVIRREKYKGAGDQLRTDKFDEYAREQYQALLDGTMAFLRDRITSSPENPEPRGFTKEILDEMIGGRIFTAPESLEAKMVDELRTPDDLTNEWVKNKYKEKKVRKPLFMLSSHPKIAVLVFEGMIVDGNNSSHPLFGQAIGDRPMIRSIRALRKNSRVKGVIFRINSGGGSATASENVLRELIALHKVKPLVVSMGPVAGSGGYWIGTTGRRLFALPTTMTGSIGVLALFFNISRLLHKHGITTDRIRHGESADLGSSLRQLTEKEHRMVDNLIGFLYKEFISRVADFRKMTSEQVLELAQGRLWLGQEAVNHNLVDETGGLHDAIAHLKEILKVKKVRIKFEPRQTYLMRILDRPGVAALLRGEESAVGATDFPGDTPLMHLLDLNSDEGAGEKEKIIFISIIRACLSLHGRVLLMDPYLSRLMSGP
jgi:protease IV